MSEIMSIRALRANRGKSQEECADALEMSRPTYKAKEENPRKFLVPEAINLARFLGYDLKFFFENLDEYIG